MTGSPLTELIGEQLASVNFLHDFVEFGFGHARFTAYAWPAVTIGDVTRHFGDPGYRDALCAFITHEVTVVRETPEVGLSIGFGLGVVVTNPEPADLAGPEIAQLHVADPMHQTTSLAVWRPGEGPFAGRG